MIGAFAFALVLAGASCDGDELRRAIAALSDADPAVRAAAASDLSDLGTVRAGAPDDVAALVASLVERARDDADASVRAAAAEALGRLDEPRALDALAGLLPDLATGEQVTAATALAGALRGGAAVERAVRDERARRRIARGRLEPDAFAALLEGLGPALAEAGEAALDPARSAALFAAATRGTSVEGDAAWRGIEAAIARWLWMERADLAAAFLDLVAAEVPVGTAWRVRRAALVLGEQGDAAIARRLAEAIGSAVWAEDDPAHAYHALRARIVEAAAHVALGAPDAAAAPLAAARALADALSARRLERHAGGGRGTRGDVAAAAEALRAGAMVELWGIVVALARGRDATDPWMRGRARELHTSLLRLHAQAFDWESTSIVGGFDDVLEGEDAPRRMLGLDERHATLPRARWLALQRELGRALAFAAPDELPGYLTDDEARTADDALADPARREAYADLRRAELELVQRRLSDDRENRRIWFRQLEVLREQQAKDATAPAALRLYRTPSVAALLLAVDLRGEGDPAASLEVAERFQAALADGRGGPLWREWTLARASMAIGAAHTDLSRPAEAERELLRAVARLEALERDLRERLAELGAGVGMPALAAETDARRRRGIEVQIEVTRNYLADAFVSLAVNANVRANDPERAVGFFERAFELRQGDFMVVLLACYRARVGRFDEARALLRGVHDAPPLYYNLACTHALLGDADLAVEYLAKSLEHAVRSAGARARQREWARDDPDLVSLRGDPRFEALTR